VLRTYRLDVGNLDQRPQGLGGEAVKEAFIGVLTGLQGLGDGITERPVDRLGAMGMAARRVPDQDRAGNQTARGQHACREATLCALGKDLIAFKGANRASAKADAEDVLAALLASYSGIGLKGRQRLIVARQAVMEFAIDMCPSCSGARKTPDHEGVEGTQPTSECLPCHGTGKRRYSDAERTAAMGRSFDKAMDKAHELIATAEALAVRRAKEMLERWT
jgi:hypothetical protein